MLSVLFSKYRTKPFVRSRSDTNHRQMEDIWSDTEDPHLGSLWRQVNVRGITELSFLPVMVTVTHVVPLQRSLMCLPDTQDPFAPTGVRDSFPIQRSQNTGRANRRDPGFTQSTI